MEKLLSEVTEILFFSRVTVTDSPRAPALPPTLIRSWRNFSREAMSMILSSTGFAQSMTNVAPFFLPLGPAAAPRLIFPSFFCVHRFKVKKYTELKRKRETKQEALSEAEHTNNDKFSAAI